MSYSAGFVAVLGEPPAAVPGTAVWPDLPGLRVYGPWLPGEVVTAGGPRGRLLVLGHRLPAPETVVRDFAAALDADDLDRLTRWSGAYTLVIALPGELVAYTDLAGQFPVHCSTSGGTTVLSAHAGVVARLHRRLPDPLTAAARIACPDVLPLWSERSAYREVRRIGGGMAVRIGPGGPRVRAYELPDQVPRRREAYGPAATARVRAALLDAVDARRARGDRLGADFSGGLDSSSLAFLAVRGEAAPPLHAVTYAHPEVPAADLAEATAFARLSPRIRQAVVRGSEETLPYQDLAAGEFGCSEPAPTLVSWRRAALRFAHAAEQGIAVHLTGEGGDALFGAPPVHLAELARRGALTRLARHCAAHARARHESPARLAGRAVGTALTRPETALRRLAATLSGPADGPPTSRWRAVRSSPGGLGWADAVSWWPVWPEAVGWLRPEARAGLAAAVAEPSVAHAVPGGFGAFDLATLAELRASADTQCFMRELGQRYGVAVHAPYLDNEVVRACLAAPVFDRVEAGVPKPLLSSALRGLVPGRVLERRGKGDYIGEDYRGARRAAAELGALFTGSRLAAAGVVDDAAVRRSLTRLTAGVAIPMGPFNRLVATEVWLRKVAR
ncbi:asparagine synthase-related protein [Nonomuraea sp. NPDC046570]|uniref:asparagine synthase-related protein n=1 Tax=Nonomuraea sp. NPDC046570 TaxID=3155255 RepID=UPI0033F2C7A7